MIGHPDRILQECGIVVAVGMRNCIAKILNVIMRNLMRVGAQRRELKPSLHRLERKGIDFDGIKKIFPALLRREKIVSPGAKRISAEFPGVAAAVETDGFCEMQAMLSRGPRQQVGPSDAVDDVRDLD